MIDTDKYEGHTGPWLLIDGDIYKGGPKGTHKSDNMIADTAFGGYETTKARYADRLLMADAPLLLEELKRLQDAIKEAVEVVKEMEGMAYAGADADKFANHALEFIGNVKEMVE